MNTRIFRLGIALSIALIGLIFFGTVVGLAATPTESSPVEIDYIPENDIGPNIRAIRAISIPFGINDSALLENNGRQIVVTGPGECQEGGETYKLRVIVTQDSTHARAKGRTEDDCDVVVDDGWETNAKAQGPRTFEPGDAQVCAMAIVFVPRDGAVTQKWCKGVTLE